MTWRQLFLAGALVPVLVTSAALGATKLVTASQSVTPQPVVQDTAQPKLPAFVRSVYGPVRVIVKPNLKHEGAELYGMWFPDIRTIFVRDSLTPWFARYAVLEHELCHVALTDAEVSLPEPVEEAVCNAIARQRSIEAQR